MTNLILAGNSCHFNTGDSSDTNSSDAKSMLHSIQVKKSQGDAPVPGGSLTRALLH